MASTYKATRNLRCWKRHKCVWCGCAFRYRFERKLEAAGASEAAAEIALQKKLTEAFDSDVNVCPCPDCGLVQPDMVAKYRRQMHLLATGVAAAALLVAFVGGSVLGFPRWAIAAGSGLIVLAAAAAHLAVIVFGPNRDPHANKSASKALADDGKLEVLEHGRSRTAARNIASFGGGEQGLIAGHLLPLLVIAATAFVPDSARGEFPDVIERRGRTGSTIRVEVGAVTCFDGRWRGDAFANVVNDRDFPGSAPAIKASSQQDRWPTDYTSRSNSLSVRKVWVELTLPDGDQYDGKTLELDVTVRATYPVIDDKRTELIRTTRGFKYNVYCKDQTSTIRKTVRVHMTSGFLPSVGAGPGLATAGLLGGLAATAVLGGMLVSRGAALAKDANRVKVEYDRGKKDPEADDERPHRRRDDD